MVKRTPRQKLARRLGGIPRSLQELDPSLTALNELRRLGWQRSVRAKQAMDGAGNPLPWWCYPAIHWLDSRVRPTDRAFEYGAGASTLWFARRVASIVSVESDGVWAQRIQRQLPDNGTVLYRPIEDDSSGYAGAIESYGGTAFDLIVIDGKERCDCARRAPRFLAEDGLILFDNSDRSENRAGYEALLDDGFLHVDFVGLAPASGNLTCTTAFFRDPARWLGDRQIPDALGY